MSVKVKNRHKAKDLPVQKSRVLIEYILILTRPRIFNDQGKQITKPGILGEGQPLQVFGYDIINSGKKIHAKAYSASQIHLKDSIALEARTKLHKEAIEYCDVLLRLIDLCIYQYARNSKKKQNSFKHLAKLVLNTKYEIQDRMNRDKLIFEQHYSKK